MQPSIHLQQEAADTFFTMRYLVIFGGFIVVAVLVLLVLLRGFSGSGISYVAVEARDGKESIFLEVHAKPGWMDQLCGWQDETFVVLGKKDKNWLGFEGDMKWIREDGKPLASDAQERLNDAYAVWIAKNEVVEE